MILSDRFDRALAYASDLHSRAKAQGHGHSLCRASALGRRARPRAWRHGGPGDRGAPARCGGGPRRGRPPRPPRGGPPGVRQQCRRHRCRLHRRMGDGETELMGKEGGLPRLPPREGRSLAPRLTRRQDAQRAGDRGGLSGDRRGALGAIQRQARGRALVLPISRRGFLGDSARPAHRGASRCGCRVHRRGRRRGRGRHRRRLADRPVVDVRGESGGMHIPAIRRPTGEHMTQSKIDEAAALATERHEG